MYEIQSKSDFQSGATLIVRIPEEELDKKALYTILADKPDFVLPFRQRAIDGQIELTYQIGNRSKLAFLSGNRTPSEYADLWFGILQPLLDCDDWFMTPYSFVLESEYLYCDKAGKSVSFVYIPSVRAYSDYEMLKGMVTEVAKQNRVTDINLENKVVWAIQDLNPKQFLQMIKPYEAHSVQESIPQFRPEPVQQFVQPKQPTPNPPVLKPANEHKYDVPKASAGTPKMADDFAIHFPADGKAPREEKSKGGLFGSKKESKKEKEVKSKPESKTKGGFWGKKNKEPQEIIQGAAATLNQKESAHLQPMSPVYTPPIDMDDDVTQLDVNQSSVAKFRYVGHGDHPRVIEVNISEGGIFTIGRFDASVGTKQSSFEFDKKTKSVSRRHAAVERRADGYNIVDLSSSAGTFINGQKLPPNAPFKLERGYRVSFGQSGADYQWED